jgi:hypothetical protein
MPGPGPQPFIPKRPLPFIVWHRPLGADWLAIARVHSYADAVRELDRIRSIQPGAARILIEGRRP